MSTFHQGCRAAERGRLRRVGGLPVLVLWDGSILVIDPDTAGSPTQSIQYPGLSPAAGATITSPTGGDGCVRLTLISPTVWQATETVGAWTTP